MITLCGNAADTLSAKIESAHYNDEHEREEKWNDGDSEDASCRSSARNIPRPHQLQLDEDEQEEQSRHGVDAKRRRAVALRVNERPDGVADHSAQAAALPGLRAARTFSTTPPASVRASTAASAAPADHPPA